MTQEPITQTMSPLDLLRLKTLERARGVVAAQTTELDYRVPTPGMLLAREIVARLGALAVARETLAVNGLDAEAEA